MPSFSINVHCQGELCDLLISVELNVQVPDTALWCLEHTIGEAMGKLQHQI